MVTKSKHAADMPTLPKLPEELEVLDELELLDDDELEDELELEDEELELLEDDELELDDELSVVSVPPQAVSPKIMAAADRARNGTALVKKARYDM